MFAFGVGDRGAKANPKNLGDDPGEEDEEDDERSNVIFGIDFV